MHLPTKKEHTKNQNISPVKLAILSEASIFGAEAVLANTPRDHQAKVLSAYAEFLILSKEAYLVNAINLRLSVIFTQEVSVVQKWRASFFQKLKSRLKRRSIDLKLPLQKTSFEEKMKTIFDKKTNIEVPAKASQSLNKTNENREQSEAPGENMKKSQKQKHLLRIIKSSEFMKRFYSERDQLALIQVQMNHKEQVFEQKNKKHSFIDLSIEDQKARLDDLLKKKLMVFKNKDKKSPQKKHDITRKIKIFPENKEKELLEWRNITFRVKKSKSFASTLKDNSRQCSLPSFIVKNSMNPEKN